MDLSPLMFEGVLVCLSIHQMTFRTSHGILEKFLRNAGLETMRSRLPLLHGLFRVVRACRLFSQSDTIPGVTEA